MESNKVLITGSSGFVGSNLVNCLSNNVICSITGVSRNKSFFPYRNCDYEVFFNNDESFKHYLHLAGKAHDTDYKASREFFFEANYELTKKVFNRFLNDEGADSFIFMSSIAAAASKSEMPLNESCIAEPSGFYGESKREAEKYILGHLPLSGKKRVYSLRPPMIHGPGNKGNLNLLYSIISKGIPWPLSAFDNSRSFLSIENLCYVITNLIKGEVESGIYHVADDELLSTTDLVEMIARINGKKANLWNIPKPLIKIIAKTGNVLPFPLNEERLNKLTENYLVSNEKIKKALGIERMPISAKEGMINTLKSFES